MAGGRNWTVALAAYSSLALHCSRAARQASCTACPPIRVMREAEALPALGASALSSVTISTLLERQAERLGGDLAQGEVRALADLGRADAHDGALQLGLP